MTDVRIVDPVATKVDALIQGQVLFSQLEKNSAKLHKLVISSRKWVTAPSNCCRRRTTAGNCNTQLTLTHAWHSHAFPVISSPQQSHRALSAEAHICDASESGRATLSDLCSVLTSLFCVCVSVSVGSYQLSWTNPVWCCLKTHTKWLDLVRDK